MTFVRALRAIRKTDIDIAGGKGASLGEMLQASVPVPEGFVVLTSAFQRFLEETNTLAEIRTIVHSIGAHETRAAERASEKIRQLILSAHMPDDIAAEIRSQFDKLGAAHVAVRSSATEEDLLDATSAGQQDSYLNIEGGAELLTAVRKVWASAWNERAILYREHQGISHESVQIAVVVQRMVDASFAGVMFTANPITGNRKETVIDANPGLGESVVVGLSTPDHVVLKKNWGTWQIVTKQRGAREVVIEPKQGGGTERVAGHHNDELPDSVLRELAQRGRTIERYFGCPQDIEWVWTGTRVHIVQARPITALISEAPRPGFIRRMVASSMAEFVPSRPHPLEMSVIAILIDECMPLFNFFGVSLPRAERFFDIKDGIPIRYVGGVVLRPSFSLLMAPFRFTSSAIRYSAATWRNDPILQHVPETLKQIELQDFSALSTQEVIRKIQSVRDVFAQALQPTARYMPSALFGLACVRLMLLCVGRSELFSILVFSGLKTKVIETNHALENLAAHIRSTPVLADVFQKNEEMDLQPELRQTKEGREFLKLFYVFLDTYGYREGAGTLLISAPSWKESPNAVLSMLKGPASSEHFPKTGNLSWTSARDEVIKSPLLQLSFMRSFFLRSLQAARCTQEIKEDTRFYIMMMFSLLRKILREIGNRMSSSGIIDLPEDVYWLTWDELREAATLLSSRDVPVLALQARIVKRKHTYTKLATTPFIDPRLFRTRANADGSCLIGMPGSPGIAEGQVRVITNGEQFSRLRLGEILVAHYTNPAWTPLFQRAAAVVVDTGSVVSHAAIVAREYGIPAVMATAESTTRLKDGDRVRVDGTVGSVCVVR